MIPFIDLHCHSTFSDGTSTPAEIVAMAKNLGLKAVTLTDHDTTLGLPELFSAAKTNGLEAIPGIEFSCHLDKESVHVLAYHFDPAHPAIIELEKRHLERRLDRSQKMQAKLKALGIDIDLSKTQAKGVIGRPHIAALLIEKGVVKDIKEAFTKFLGEGKAGYVEAFTISLDETLSVIKQAGGISVLAHPHLLTESYLFNRLMKYPFDGVECYYGNFTMQQNERYLKKAIEKNLLITGGSDFHGEAKPQVRYGSSFVTEETFRKLKPAIALF